MNQPNPFNSPQHDPADTPQKATPPTAGKVAYNVVTDVVIGPNVRLKDNLFQAIAVLAGGGIGAGIGAVLAEERALGAIVGGGGGVLVGLFGSGIFLMIYRAVRHWRGKHD